MSDEVRLITRETFIYFIQAVDGGLIKIGRADDPRARLRELQIGSPLILRLCRSERAPQTWETRLHQAFAAYRMHGEWFRPHPLLAHVADAIPDPALEGDALPLANITATDDLFLGMWCERGGPIEGLDLGPPPKDELERLQRRIQNPYHESRDGMTITARPPDMEPVRNWRQSSEGRSRSF